MIKKLLRTTMTFIVLLAAYNGYSRGFAILAGFVAKPRTVPRMVASTAPSDSQKKTREMAAAAFGPDHWSVRAPLTYYDLNRGYCIYYRDQERSADGKTWEFSPVAIVVLGKDGRELKSIVAKKAKLDFNRPFDVSKPGDDPAYVTHASLYGEVVIRSDKGTPSIADDLVIGPHDSLEYDEKTERIYSQSEERIVLRQGGTTVSGVGLEMNLVRRPKPIAGDIAQSAPTGPGEGFDGVRTIRLFRDVEIDVLDVGHSGIVPGGVGLSATATTNGKSRPVKVEPKPGHIQCAGEMRIDLPPNRPVPLVGPPAPPDPTLATFVRNVRVQQGRDADLDQLDCDRLETVLLPPEPTTESKKKAAILRDRKAAKAAASKLSAKSGATTKDQPKAATSDDEEESGGAISNLSLHRAHATGHAVWLQSTSQNMRGVGNELRFQKFGADQPDQIYFRGDKQTEVVKTEFFTEGKDVGKAKSIDTLRTKDVTIYRYPPGGPAPSMVARGPGTMETRAAGSNEVERFASWRDELKMVSVLGSEMRKITLTGHPRVRSTTQGDISADKEIIADLTPKAKDEPVKVVAADGRTIPVRDPDAMASAKPKGDAMRLKHVKAVGNVRLVTIEVPEDLKATPPRPASPRRELLARIDFETDFVDAPASPKAEAAPKLKVTTADTPKELTAIVDASNPPVAVEPKAPEPAMTAVADHVTAVVMQQAGTDKGQVEEAKLWGKAEVHQAPAQGKSQGSDLTGQTIYVWNKGENRARLQAKGNPARAVTEGREIVGQILQLDQAEDHAWVSGMGYMKLEQDGTDFLDDTAKIITTADVAKRKAEQAKGPKKGPLVITWGKGPDDKAAMMHFYGKTLLKNGQPGPAKAIFYSHVLARTDDSQAQAEDRMTATFDGQIPFVRPKRDPAEEKARKARGEKENRPEIATILLEKDAKVVARTFDDNGFLKDKKVILHPNIFYDKAVGEFVAKGAPGEVFLYTTSTKEESGPLPMANERRTVKPASARVDVGKPNKVASQPPLTLTHVRFQKRMDGRFGAPKDAKPGDYSSVFFFGAVEAISAKVKDENEILDPDSPPDDYYRLVSDYMTINVEPPPSKNSKDKDRVLLDAWNYAKAFTRDKTITGERITYDSLSELSYVYGNENGVLIQNQDGPGQQLSQGRGDAVRYNHKSGQHQLINPKTFDLIDPRSGKRSALTQYEPNQDIEKRDVRALQAPGRPIKPRDPNDAVLKAKQLRLPPRSSSERRGFNGR